MKTMIATVGICLAFAVAGCAQKAESTANLGAFDDTTSSSCCASKAASSCSSAKAASSCCASKAKATCPMSTKMSTEVN